MKTTSLKYKVINTDMQYKQYSKLRQELLLKPKTKQLKDEIELLSVLIDKYNLENIYLKYNPVQLLEYLLEEHQLKPIELSRKLKISPGVISDILNYRKRFSKNLIRKLAVIFNIPTNPFNRAYALKQLKIGKNSGELS